MSEQNYSVQMNIEGKNILVAYLLWWFLGFLGVHRFYLGRPKSGVAQLVLLALGFATLIIVIGYVLLIALFVWWCLDAYFTYKIVQEENEKLGVQNSTISLNKNTTSSDLDSLEKLHGLFEKGVLTKEQYEEKKAALL
ncbi:NINE protein [Thalassotalea maritima]|uniref:NINE protein n=1 Tax=Thalassotalea maritima TaxID=3242416 RepID=UPI0035272ED0